MLRKPGSLYENKRSSTLLKVKYFHDEEAKVVGQLPGTGRLQHMMGKLVCRLPNGTQFKVGTGFSDAERKKPPKTGSVITFKYQELSDHGNPRFPVFLRERTDLTWEDVCENAKTKTPFSQLKQRKPELKKQHSILFSRVPSRDQLTGNKILTSDDEDDHLTDQDQDHFSTSTNSADISSDSGSCSSSSTNNSISSIKKPLCKYGQHCFRTNPIHLQEYEHPYDPSKDSKDSKDSKTDSQIESKKEKTHYQDQPSKKRKGTEDSNSPADPATETTSKKAQTDKIPPCQLGAKCYRILMKHLSKYSHPDVDLKDLKEEIRNELEDKQNEKELNEYFDSGILSDDDLPITKSKKQKQDTHSEWDITK